jgi:hypothetical protein
MHSIKAELDEWAPQVANPLYRERIKQRVSHDLEMIEQTGYCSGIENYSVHLDGRKKSHDHNGPDPRDGITCLRASDLSEAWHAHTRHDANAILQIESLLYVGTDAGTIECIDATTGGTYWPEPPRLSAAVLARPIPTPAGILVCAVDGHAALLDRGSGAMVATANIEGGLVGDPLIFGDRVLFATQAGWVVEAPLAEPLRWASDAKAPDVRRIHVTRAGFDEGSEYSCWFTASPVRLEGTVFLPHSRETSLPGVPVAALERRRFQVRYTTAEPDHPGKTYGNIRARPALANGLVIVPAAYSNLTVAFDRIAIRGRAYPIRATVIQAIESEGIRGETTRIGAGAGVGAIIGGILGGVKGALAGILIGGGGVIAATEGRDVELPAGSVLRVRLDSPLVLR